MAKLKKKSLLLKRVSESFNVIPLCLSCAYFALLIGTAYASKVENAETPIILIVIGFVLGVLIFFPFKKGLDKKIKLDGVKKNRPVRNRGQKLSDDMGDTIVE